MEFKDLIILITLTIFNDIEYKEVVYSISFLTETHKWEEKQKQVYNMHYAEKFENSKSKF
jgi:hypothetical protein